MKFQKRFKIILCCLIIVKLQTCSSDKSNFPFKNLFFNCYFFIFSKSFSVLSECFIHDIATLLYMPLKIHRPPIACLPPIAHRLPTAHRLPPITRPPIARPLIAQKVHRPPIAHRPATFYSPQGGLFVPCQAHYKKMKIILLFCFVSFSSPSSSFSEPSSQKII